MTLYLDTSSLVKLFVEEIGSSEVLALVGAADVVATSVIAYPEARAAFARLRRDGHFTAARLTTIKRNLEAQWTSVLTLDVTAAVSRVAGELAEKYALRGFDATHLASFAEIARRAGPQDTRFSSFDEALNRAAHHLALRLG